MCPDHEKSDGRSKVRIDGVAGSTESAGSKLRCSNKIRRAIARFVIAKCGSALIEFSLIAFLLLFLIFATIEVGFVYWATKQLETGSSDAARLVRTGQVHAESWTRAQLKQQICSRARILPACTANLRLDVRSADTLGEITSPDPFDGDGDLRSDGEFAYEPGDPSSISLLTAFYSWPVGFFGGPYLLRASTPMRNEPFEVRNEPSEE